MTETATPSQDEDITRALGPAAALFGGQYTLLVRACHAHGLTSTLAAHLQKVYLEAQHVREPRIIESLLSIALHHCENQYCYVIHSAWLLNQDVSVEEISGLLLRLEMPEGVADRKRWSTVLRCTYFAFMEDHAFASNMAMVRRVLDEDEYRDYVQILALASFLRTTLLCFPEEIDVHREPFLFGGELTEQAREILSISEARIAKRTLARAEGSRDLVSLCMYCKDIRAEGDRWVPIESCLSQLSVDTLFSHGMCPKCFSREYPNVSL